MPEVYFGQLQMYHQIIYNPKADKLNNVKARGGGSEGEVRGGVWGGGAAGGEIRGKINS